MPYRLISAQVSIFISLFVGLLLLGSCKKREARILLLGDWKVTGYKGVIVDSCSQEGRYFDVNGDFGSIAFDRRLLNRDYTLVTDSLRTCMPFASANDLPKWKVIDHKNELFVAHRYALDIDGLTWYLLFGDEAVGERPEDQEVAYLSHLSNNGDAFALEITKVRGH